MRKPKFKRLTVVQAEADMTKLMDLVLSKDMYNEAIFLATMMRVLGHKINMERRWQWIRDLSVNTGFFEQCHGIEYPRSEKESRMLEVQIEILRLAGPLDMRLIEKDSAPGSIIAREPWELADDRSKSIGVHVSDPRLLVESSWFDEIRSRFRIIEDIPGHLRERQNVSSARYWASGDDAVSLSPESPSTAHHLHPDVPHLHFLKDVLYPEECVQIISAAESVGFQPDIPILPGGIRGPTRALYFYWVIDQTFYDKLWSRVEAFVPKVFAGKQVRGLNRWFRLYKYVPGQEFPAHFGM
jgi:hypothetical protein